MHATVQINKPSKLIITVSAVLLAFSLLNLVLSYVSLTQPMDSSEFAGLNNFVLGIAAFLVIILSTLTIISGLFMLRRKLWALILSFICVALIIPILAVSDLREAIFELSPGAPISWNHEILPVLILILLIIAFKDFRKKTSTAI